MRGKHKVYAGKTRKKGILTGIKAYIDHNRLGELLMIGGYICPHDLKLALTTQRATQKPLGAVLIENRMISRRQLALILARQKTLRLIAGLMLCFMSLSFSGKTARADSIPDVPAKIGIAVTATTGRLDNIGRISVYPALFGAEEKRSENLKAFTKWSSMFERFDAEMKTPSGRKIVLELQNELARYRSLSLPEMAEKVNTMMNRKKYIVDNKNWGKSDYWATPVEFMVRGGDCEDFAIAKYAALRALGVSESRLRLTIVHDEIKNIPHAVLAVYTDKGPLILDNQIKTVRLAGNITHYKPIFSINREAWWLHTAPETTVIASAR